MIADRHKVRRLDREAAAWFTRLNDVNGVEADDLEAFDRWRKKPKASAAYRRVEDICLALQAVSGDADIQQAMREAFMPAPSPTPRPADVLTRTTWRILGGVALAGALATAIAIAIQTKPIDYETPIGGRSIAELADGSHVELNTDSLIRVRYGLGRRDVELVRGQALFDVAHDASKPFTVKAGPMRVRAVGTRFDVRRDDGSASVALVQGKVRVSGGPLRAKWMLAPGQAMTLGGLHPDTSPRAADVQSVSAWTNGEVVFQDTPLAQAVAEMNRYARKKIVLGAGAPADAKVNGVFSTGNIREFLGAVTMALDLQMRQRNDGTMELHATPGG